MSATISSDVLDAYETPDVAVVPQGLRDALTGLANRRQAGRYIDKLLRSNAPSPNVVVCLVELDRYQDMRRSLGSTVCDSLLVEAGRRLRLIAERPDVLVARLHHSTFAIVAPDGPDPAYLAQSALDVLSEPYLIAGRTMYVAATAGAVARAERGVGAAELMSAATNALMRAKVDGRDQGRDCCTAHCDARRHDRHIEAAIPRGIAEGQFYLQYQPMVDLRRDQVVGYEALARWRHPEFGTLQPESFIGIAESTGYIRSLGAQLLQQACLAAARWSHVGGEPRFVSVNLSYAQLAYPGLVCDVTRALDGAHLPATALQLELTERAATMTGGHCRRNLLRLAEMGVRLSIDDFGTGYSNLSRLTELPLHGMKLDWSLLHEPSEASAHKHRAVLTAAVRLGQALDLCVTAEGVETKVQADLVRELGCHVGQGWHFGRPAERLDVY